MPSLVSKPKRPFHGIADAKRHYIDRAHQRRTYASDEYPCQKCHGLGTVRNPDECDPIEGYKLANWYPCPECSRSGKTNLEVFLKVYRRDMADYRKDLELWRAQQKVLNKLKPAERALVGL